VDAQSGVAVRDLVAFEYLDRVHAYAGKARRQGIVQPGGFDGIGAGRKTIVGHGPGAYNRRNQ
jgi:hypothetical protein